jgi:hypothetical protein
MKGSTILGGVAGLALLFAGSTASAQSIIRNNDSHPHLEIDVHGTFGYGYSYYGFGYGFGGGVRVGIPIVPAGFLSQVNDSFALSVGGDFLWLPNYYSTYSAFSIIGHVDAQWNFYLHEKFSVFAEAGFAPEFYFGDWLGPGRCNGCSVFYPWFDLAVGGRWHFRGGAQYPTLTFRLGTTGGTIGVSF